MFPRLSSPEILARHNELLVRVRRPLDMGAQALASIGVALLLDGYLSDAWRAAYVGATLSIVLLQYLIHRTFRADRTRRQRVHVWLARLFGVYLLNASLFGAMLVALVRLPVEPASMLALICVMGMVVSVTLTVAVQLTVSVLVLLPAMVPGITFLLASGEAGHRVLGGIGFVLMILVMSFAFRLNRFFTRSADIVERLRGMLRDRTQMSEDAERAQDRLRSILDTAPFPIVVVRRGDGAFLYSNRPAAELFGIGSASSELAPRYVLDPVHRDRIFGAEPLAPEEELQIATAQGRAIWATIASVPMRYGDDDGALVVVNDVTAKRASEERLREAEQRLSDALAAAPDGVALFDADERLVICNKAYADIIGIPLLSSTGTMHDEICTRAVATRPVPERAGVRTDYPDWAATRKRIFKAAIGEPHIFYDTRDRRWLQIRDFRLTSGGTASLITDISELKQRERELREANENLAAQAEALSARGETLEAARQAAIKAHQDAEYANRAKSQFLAHMSHELRTPLNAINGFSEIMALKLLGPSGVPQYDRYAEDILAAGRHLLSVIDDILDLSKVEAGKMKLTPELVPWSKLASDCLTLLRPLAADRMVTLQAEPGTENATIFADERLTKQMLVNLLSNAVKYTPSGGKAWFRFRPDNAGGGIIEVTDTGVGMNEADLQKALEPFGRIDSALVSQMRGTGLGLPLVKALVELHQGRLEIDSAVGRGTTVRLHFPPARQAVPTGKLL